MRGLKTHKNLSFGTSPDNELGLKLSINFDEDTKTAYSNEIVIPSAFQGHQANYVHPGIISLMLDEVMMYIGQAMNLEIETGELTIRYLHPAKTGTSLHLRGYFVKKTKRIIESRAEIEDHIGKIVARAKGKYLEINPLEEEPEK